MEQIQQTQNRTEKQNVFSTKNLAKIAVLTAISYVLYMFVKFPLPFFPQFLDIQFSDLPALIGGFAMGPVAGCIIIVAKCLLKMPFSSTACVGEIGDIIIGIAFVLPAALIYKKHKNKKGALIGLVVGALVGIAAAMLANWVLLIPFYVKAFGWEAIIGMVAELYPGITQQTFFSYYLFLGVAPFNLLRFIVSGGLTFLVYKHVSPILHM